jgi:hypothetical protein
MRSPLVPSPRPLLVLALAALAAACGTTSQQPPQELVPGTPLPVTLQTHEDSIDVLADGELFATVRFGDDEGPCVFPLHAVGEVLVTRGYPIAPGPDDDRDHPHHRSLWFAHGDVDGVDFWHGKGRIETLGFEVALPAPSFATVDLALEWRAGDGHVLVRERRRYTFHAQKGLRWVDAQHALEPANSGVVFGDTKEGTFALRLAPTLNSEGAVATGRLCDAEGRVDGDVWGKRSPWIAATGEVPTPTGERRVLTVALLEHPRNLRAPTWWHARTYGLLAANPFGRAAFEGDPSRTDGSLALARGETLVLRYRVLLGDGPLTPEHVAAEATRFADDAAEGGVAWIEHMLAARGALTAR